MDFQGPVLINIQIFNHISVIFARIIMPVRAFERTPFLSGLKTIRKKSIIDIIGIDWSQNFSEHVSSLNIHQVTCVQNSKLLTLINFGKLYNYVFTCYLMGVELDHQYAQIPLIRPLNVTSSYFSRSSLYIKTECNKYYDQCL